jgi:hypothetical protein
MIAQSVAGLLADHFRLTVEGIDRMYLNVYVPWLQCAYGAVSFFRDHRGQPLASSALMSPMSRRFVAELDRFYRAASASRRIVSQRGQPLGQTLGHTFGDAPAFWYPLPLVMGWQGSRGGWKNRGARYQGDGRVGQIHG